MKSAHLDLFILWSNCWAKIELTARQESAFPRCVVRLVVTSGVGTGCRVRLLHAKLRDWLLYCQWRRHRHAQYAQADWHFRRTALPRCVVPFHSQRVQNVRYASSLPKGKCRGEVVRIGSVVIFHQWVSYEKPSSSYCMMQCFWWGWRGNLKLITVGSERVKALIQKACQIYELRWMAGQNVFHEQYAQ